MREGERERAERAATRVTGASPSAEALKSSASPKKKWSLSASVAPEARPALALRVVAELLHLFPPSMELLERCEAGEKQTGDLMVHSSEECSMRRAVGLADTVQRLADLNRVPMAAVLSRGGRAVGVVCAPAGGAAVVVEAGESGDVVMAERGAQREAEAAVAHALGSEEGEVRTSVVQLRPGARPRGRRERAVLRELLEHRQEEEEEEEEGKEQEAGKGRSPSELRRQARQLMAAYRAADAELAEEVEAARRLAAALERERAVTEHLTRALAAAKDDARTAAKRAERLELRLDEAADARRHAAREAHDRAQDIEALADARVQAAAEAEAARTEAALRRAGDAEARCEELRAELAAERNARRALERQRHPLAAPSRPARPPAHFDEGPDYRDPELLEMLAAQRALSSGLFFQRVA